MKKLKTKYELRNFDDADYLMTLPPEQRAWYQHFRDEYYKFDIRKGGQKSLHNTDVLRHDCYQRQYAAQSELTTRHPDKVAEAQKPSKAMDRFKRFYSPDDYYQLPNVEDIEDTLITIIDGTDAKSK